MKELVTKIKYLIKYFSVVILISLVSEILFLFYFMMIVLSLDISMLNYQKVENSFRRIFLFLNLWKWTGGNPLSWTTDLSFNLTSFNMASTINGNKKSNEWKKDRVGKSRWDKGWRRGERRIERKERE